MKRSAAASLLVALLGTSGVARPEGLAHLTVTDRFGRGVPATLCAVVADRCAPIVEQPIPVLGTDLLVRISAPGFETQETRLVPGEQSVKLKARGSVSASLVSTEQNQEWMVEVSLVRDESGRKGRNLESRKVLLPKAPEAKAISLEDVPPGDYWLSWEGPQIASDAIRVSVKEPEAVSAGKIEIRGGLSLRGFVRETSGAPIPEARVNITDPTRISVHQPGWNAETAESGEFTFTGLPIGRLRWTARAKGYVEASGEWSGEPVFDITLEKAQLVRGRVVNERQEPVADVRLYASFRSKGGLHGVTPPATTAEGTFELFRDLPGELSLRFSAPKHLVKEMKVPEAADKTILDLGDVILSRGRIITGTVVDGATGQPVDGAEVVVPQSPATTTTANGGRFTLETVPDSDVTLLASAPGYARTPLLVSKELSEARIPMARGGTLKVRICGGSAELAELGMTAQATTNSALREEREANGTGEFELVNVSPGEYRIGVQWKVKSPSAGYLSFVSAAQTSNTRVRVEDGQPVSVSLRCEGLQVSGVVTRETLSFTPIWGVLRTENDRWISEFRVDQTGRFSTRVPAPDRYLLNVFFPNGLKGKEGEFCVVPEGGKADCMFTVTGR